MSYFWTYWVMQKNSCMFEFSRPLSAHWPRHPMHSPSALTEHVSLNLARFFVRPCTAPKEPWYQSRAREDHIKSDLDQRSRSDKWSRSFYLKDHLKWKDQDPDQDHLKRSLCCTKDGAIYCVLSHILLHWWVLKSVFQMMLKSHLFITNLLKQELRGPLFGILGMHTKWSHGKIKD